MRRVNLLTILLPGLLFCADLKAQDNRPYNFNLSPLKQDVYVQLPLGSIKAKGWLLKQLELQRDGFTGYAEELYPEPENLGKNSDWLGGTGNSWEKVPYYVKGLVALAYTLDDATLKAKAQKWIDYTLDHQQENGLFGPPKMKDWWPRMPFMYALQSYYEATNDKRVVPFLAKYFKYQLANLDKDPLDSWGKSRAGDNMELALWVYNKTGEKYLLELVSKLKEQAYPWLDIFNKNQFFYYGDDYQPKHMVNVAQALKFPAVYAQVTQTPYVNGALQAGINHLMHDHGQPEGLAAGTEFLSGNSSVQGVETCTVVEWMQSLETASRIIHDASLGDQLEKVAFNALPAQFSRDLKNHSYYTLPNQVQSLPGGHGFNQDYSSGIVLSPYSGFPCCRYNMHMGWPYFVKNSVLATPDGGLAINTYGPMEVSAVVGNGVSVKIIEETNYPFEEQIRLTLSLSATSAFPLRLRMPAWCAKPEVLVNGKLVAGVKAAEIFTINRKWSDNDKLVLNFPMTVVSKKQVNNGKSIERGPLVFALKINSEEKNTKAYPVKGFFETEISPASPWNYGLVLDNRPMAQQVTVVKKQMPENPYVLNETPIQLKVKVRQLPNWKIDYNGTAAMEVPFSPLSSAEKTEDVLLVPYGSENIRLSIFPTIGKPLVKAKTYQQNFDNNRAEGLVIYGGGWFYKDNAIHCASNGNNSSGTQGSKVIATGTQFSDFNYSADVMVTAPGDAGLVFRVKNPAIGSEAYEGYYVGLNPVSGLIQLGKSAQKKWTVISAVKFPVKMNQKYRVKVKAIGNKFEVRIDGADKPILMATDTEYKTGSVGLRAYNALATVDNISVSEL
ncbi:MAG: beta-L-arabinofuranosidase domain-containing protein [Bacteroidota bacterium]